MAERIEKADASATRGFFVDMLVRDISVRGAVLDLIDNAVDAASMHASAASDLAGFSVELEFGAERFAIKDNCGGMDIETARNNAFRFGRPPGFDPQTSIGQFGIGMKRAIFRLGKRFRIDSSTAETRFTMDVDIERWRDEPDPQWTFPMVVADSPAPSHGTTVEVLDLHDGVSRTFAGDDGEAGNVERFARGMLREVKVRHERAINRGLEIILNGQTTDLLRHELLSGAGISPEHLELELVSRGHPVKLRIVAGIGPEGSPADSGWYVYCNGRLVLEADRTALTGWGIDDPDGGALPAWHPQYARFRGYVFFSSEHPGALPWTTTKTEIDESADVYRNARAKMQDVIRGFARFTYNLKQERDRYEEGSGGDPRPIGDAVGEAPYVALGKVPQGKFGVPARRAAPGAPSGIAMARIPPGRETTRVLFHAEVSRMEELKDALGEDRNRRIGEIAFERLYDREIGGQ